MALSSNSRITRFQRENRGATPRRVTLKGNIMKHKVAIYKTVEYDYDSQHIIPSEWEEVDDEELAALQEYCRKSQVAYQVGRRERYYLITHVSIEQFKVDMKDLIIQADKEKKINDERLRKAKEKAAKAEAARLAKKEERERKKFEALKQKYDK